MPGLEEIVRLEAAEFAALVALFLPGLVSLKVDRLIQPGRAPSAAEFVVDAFAYSLLNAGVFSWAILLTSRELTAENPNYVTLGLLGLLVCVIGRHSGLSPSEPFNASARGESG